MLVIDGNGIAARTFFATHYQRGYFDEGIFVSSFLRGFNKLIERFWEYHKQIVFCIDSKSWRHALYPGYKSGRTQKDEIYYKYIDSFLNLIADMQNKIPIIFMKKKNYEADDLLAYFANKYPIVTLVGNDKDFKQLLAYDGVKYYNFVTDQYISVPDPELELHVLICIGDDADGVPAIVPKNAKGKSAFLFGEKTVPKWYNKAHRNCIDEAYLNKQVKEKKVTADDIKKMHERYELNKRLIDLSKSPVHNENFVLPDELEYNSRYYVDLLNDNLLAGEAVATAQKMGIIFRNLYNANTIPF
jgi:5'-3' exonuclease